MDGELVPVHHGEHRIQVHEGPALGNVKGPAACGRSCSRRAPSPPRRRWSPPPSAERCPPPAPGGQDQDIAPLQGGGLAPVVPPGGVAVVRVVLENELAEQGLPVSRGGVHFVDGHAGTDGGEGVPGKIEVGQGIYGEGVIIPGGREIVPSRALFARAGTCGRPPSWQTPSPCPAGQKGSPPGSPGAGRPDAGLLQELADQVGRTSASVMDSATRSAGRPPPLPALPEAVGKGVVLPLGLLQIGDVIKEQPLQILRHQIFQLTARAVEKGPFSAARSRRYCEFRFPKSSLLCSSERYREIALV